MALFQRPKVDQREYLANLQADIFRVTEELERARQNFAQQYLNLEREFSQKKAEKEKEIADLANTLALMHAERIQLEKPIEYKREELNEREKGLKQREIDAQNDIQRAFERERTAERKLESVQELADELGEARIRIKVKENLLLGRENSFKEKETQYLVKIEKSSKEVKEALVYVKEREDAVLVKELNVQGKEENLERREKELLEGYVLLNDRRTLLEKGFKELKEKQHGGKKRTER